MSRLKNRFLTFLAVMFTPKKVTTRPCSECRQDVGLEVNECPHCHEKNIKLCVVCAERLHVSARFCTKCDSFQGWFRRTFHVSNAVLPLLSTLVAMFTVLITQASAYYNRNSDTQISLGSVDPPVLYVYVSNTGRSPSLLREYSLTFSEEIPIQEATLQLITQDKSAGMDRVQGGGNQRIGLLVEGLQPKFRDPLTKKVPYEWEDIKKGINAGGKAVIKIEVKETTGQIPKTDTFEAKRIMKLIEAKLGPNENEGISP